MRALRPCAGLPLLASVPMLQAQQAPSTPSAEELLSLADRLRHPFPSFTVDMTVAMGGSEQRWRVRVRENGDAQVEGLSEKEKGRLILTKGDDVWLLLPSAKRPLKVSPQQRLLGPASGGDLARTRFRDDYTVVSMQPETVDGRAQWRLDLKAKRPALTFQQARLFVDGPTRQPSSAEFLFSSGKVAKTVRFHAGAQAAGKPVLRSMEIQEPRGNAALITFSGWTQSVHDAARFELPAAK